MRNVNGFTMVELMVTILVLAIIVALGVPQLQGMAETNRMVASNNKIVRDLNLARSESVKRGVAITICGSTDGATCDTPNWENGWIMFADQNRNGILEAANDTLLSVQDDMSANMTMRGRNFNNLAMIQYLPNGDLNGPAGSFVVCNQDADPLRARATNISNLGRVSRAEDSNADNIVEDVTGANVGCP